MATYAVIKTADNLCDNMIVWDDTLGPWTPPDSHYIIANDDGAGDIGWTYDPATGVWTAPPEPVEPVELPSIEGGV